MLPEEYSSHMQPFQPPMTSALFCAQVCRPIKSCGMCFTSRDDSELDMASGGWHMEVLKSSRALTSTTNATSISSAGLAEDEKQASKRNRVLNRRCEAFLGREVHPFHPSPQSCKNPNLCLPFTPSSQVLGAQKTHPPLWLPARSSLTWRLKFSHASARDTLPEVDLGAG